MSDPPAPQPTLEELEAQLVGEIGLTFAEVVDLERQDEATARQMAKDWAALGKISKDKIVSGWERAGQILMLAVSIAGPASTVFGAVGSFGNAIQALKGI